jgi:predicted dehydrogenase
MLKIGLVGAGHLGKIHLKCISLVPEVQLAGIYDSNEDIAKTVAGTYGVPSFSSLESLIEASDIVDIVTPTLSHFEVARQAIRAAQA